MRSYFEKPQDPAWPAWPMERDGDYRAWVRAHWSIEECDRFDAAQAARSDLTCAGLRLIS